jgi:hypothetical protein
MSVLPNDTLKQNENKKVTLLFLSLQHSISVTKEKFSRDSHIEEWMLFYLATVLSYSYYQERPDFDELFVHSFVFFLLSTNLFVDIYKTKYKGELHE